MPIYAFTCDQCGHQFEELVARMGQTAPCPKCGSEKVSRGLTAPADYRTDTTSSSLPSCATGACSTGTCPFA
jgi:putative FmdB family regulatory protein